MKKAIKSKNKLQQDETNDSLKVDIKIKEEVLAFVDYIYFGQVISTKTKLARKLMIAIGWKKYCSLKEILQSKDLGMNLKRKTFNSCVLPCFVWV